MQQSQERPVAIVTGASRRIGIGAATCRALAGSGHDILFTHLQEYDLDVSVGADAEGPRALAEELRGLGANVAEMHADLMDPATADAILARCTQQLGPPSVLVNNAAYSTTQNWDELTPEEFDNHYLVNFRGSSLLSIAFAKQFTRGHRGRIVSMTTGQALGPMPTELAYAASKGAIEAFVKSFAYAVGPLGITVNAVNPGPVNTGWMTSELKQYLEPKFALGRIGQPDDIGKVIAFLASPAADWITGQVINAEGGFTRD
ncbi:MAG TPA: SDR family oxidoreductase [Thermomicrobiales bacterium]|nr:SDR family oxidoreductase [Thermomicrobiales bacterium]